MVKVSTGLPNCREGRQNLVGTVTPEGIRRVARLADHLGYYSLWPNEFITTRPDVSARYPAPPMLLDVLVTMAYALAETEHIRVTPSTIVLPYHEPIVLSRELATLDVFSGGRVTLGIGLGGELEEFQRTLGTIKKPNRGQMMDEFVQSLRVLWEDRQATFHGRYVSFDDLETYPKPIQQPLPVFMAGHADGVFRRLAAYGQGLIDSNMMPDDLRAAIDHVHAYAREAGRGDVRFEIARQFYVSIAPTEAEAKANHAASVPPATRVQPARSEAARAADRPAERSLIGTPDQIQARLRAYVQAGATEICAIFYFPDDEAAERQLRLFAEEVVPVL